MRRGQSVLEHLLILGMVLLFTALVLIGVIEDKKGLINNAKNASSSIQNSTFNKFKNATENIIGQ